MKQEQWQQGNESKMTSLDRLELHILWLEQLHAEIKQEILQRKIKEFESDNDIQGFPKD